MLVDLLILIGVLLASVLGPGLFLVRHCRWASEEKLNASLGLSLVLLYLASWLIYVLHLPPGAHRLVLAGCVGLSLWCVPDILRLFRSRAVRRIVAAYGCLALWTVLLLALVRNYSGGACAWDWWEHYQRALVFLEHRPWDSHYGIVPVPARPPLMNLAAGYFLALAGKQYALFQVLFSLLNLLVIFPLYLMGRRWALPGRRRATVLLGLLTANPMLMWNATFSWTKLLTAFFVILGLWFYLEGWRRADTARMAIAFLCLAAALLVHFSAGPYVLFLGAHYLLVVLPKRPQRGRELAVVAGLSAGLLLTWFGWSVVTYGVAATVGSNTTVTEFSGASLNQNLLKVVQNVWYTLVPHPLRMSPSRFETFFSQPNRLGYWRDYALALYGTNLIVAMGSVGGLLVCYLLIRALRAPGRGRERRFWVPFIAVTALLGIAVHPNADALGVAQICCQPLVLLGVGFLAARYTTLPPLAQAAGLVGAALDAAVGVFLQFHLEHHLFQPRWVEGHFRLEGPDLMSAWALRNWMDKMKWEVVFWGDYWANQFQLIEVIALVGFAIVWVRLAVILRQARRRTS